MKLLIDTNIFIPLEPTILDDVEPGTRAVAKLLRLANQSHHEIFLHPACIQDIRRDTNASRLSLREVLFQKYQSLPDPPDISPDLEVAVGSAEPGTNNWVDHLLLMALYADAIDFLVTEDRTLYRKAIRLGLSQRVATVAETISLINDLSDVVPDPPPAVESTRAHTLNSNDPIFNSLRRDYEGFDNWLSRAKREHRQTWSVKGEGEELAGVCIVKPESSGEFGLTGSVLKICTFKISDQYNGHRFGELLLKPVFEYAHTNGYDYVYATVFEGH